MTAKRIGVNGRKKNTRRRSRAPGRRSRLFIAFGITAVIALVCTLGRGNLESKALRCASVFGALPLFTVDSISIRGAAHVNPEKLVRGCGIKFPISVRNLKTEYLEKLGAASPWIEKVKLVRSWGGTAVLAVQERTPVAMLQSGIVALVDVRGMCLPLEPGVAYSLPLISGLRDSAPSGGARRLTAESTGRMNRFLERTVKYDSSLAGRITQAHFGDRRVTILLEGSSTVAIVHENDPVACWERFFQIREMVRGDSAVPSRIDCGYRNIAFVTSVSAPRAAAADSASRKRKI